ncbi:MAG TPA: MFS transporter [Alphaproteobacteria bacterium]
MEQSKYRWVIVAAGGLIGCVAIGCMFSLPVFLTPMAADTGWSVTGISTAMTFGFLAMAFASMLWGNLSDKFGARPVVVTGSALMALSMALASQTQSLFQFQIVFGLCVGGAIAAIFAPVMATVTGWFDTHRSLAVSLVSAGMGIAPITMSPLAAWLVTEHDWRTSMLILSGLAAILMIPAAFLFKRPPALEAQAAPAEGAAMPSEMSSATAAAPQLTMGEALKSPLFIILLLTNFFCCATHSGPIFHTVSYAVACGIPMIAAVTIYSVEGLAGMGGRVVFGLMGDRFGAKRILVFGLLFQAIAVSLYFFAKEINVFYVVAALTGFVYAGVMPLYAVLARENFPLNMMGTIIGGGAMAGGLGMAIGPLAGGMIHDHFGDYKYLYLMSGAMGIGAFLIAMTFRPSPKMVPA